MIELLDIGVTYDKKNFILEHLSMEIKEGELVSLLGPSGCGKTTTLRVMAGLIEPSRGQFLLSGTDYTKVPVHKRGFGMVFQSYALFPHLSVYDNIAFGLKIKGVDKSAMEEKIKKVVEICGLKGLELRFPKQLSGGQRQRVALARAVVIEPKLLLLDEPLSNLDAKLRLSMRIEIKRIQKALGITTVFVTHDQEECFSISDRVAIMNRGVIEQYDHPEVIYRYPKTKFVASFIGFENFLEAEALGENLFEISGGLRYNATGFDEVKKGDRVTLSIRPEDIVLSEKNTEEGFAGGSRLVGEVEVRTFLGKSYQYEVKTGAGRLLITTDDSKKFESGDEVALWFPPEKLIVLLR